MSERLAVLGLGHETDTFSTVPADLPKYVDGGVHRGRALIDRHAESQATWAGFVALRQDDSVELVPLLAAWVNPCGRSPEMHSRRSSGK